MTFLGITGSLMGSVICFLKVIPFLSLFSILLNFLYGLDSFHNRFELAGLVIKIAQLLDFVIGRLPTLETALP